MFEISPNRTASPQAPNAWGSRQSQRLLLALVILVVALAAVLIKDRNFWFGTEQSTIESDLPEPTAATQTPIKTAVPSAPAARTKKQVAPTTSNPQKTDEAAAVATTRTVLPPLDVEVVAGNKHHKLHAAARATQLHITEAGSNGEPSARIEAATNAADREPIISAEPAYPPLAQNMNVRGSVVLQALIGTDGVIQNLRVLSGPAILASAAQQAVREWRFKPIVEHGQAVESKATITVNFSIRVADNAAKTTLAESRAEDVLILSR